MTTEISILKHMRAGGNKLLAPLFTLVFTFTLTQSFSQQYGAVKFQVDNANGYFEILVNDTLLIKQYKDTLPVGTYRAEAWSYGYDVEDFSFTILPDTAISVYVKLHRSTVYQAYEQNYQKYRMDFHKAVTLPLTTTLAFGVTSTIFMIKAYDLKKEVTTRISSYYASPVTSEIALIKEDVAKLNSKYNTMRTGFYIGAGFTALGVITSIYTGTKFRRTSTEPSYSKTSPFATKTSFHFTPYGCGMIIKIG
jgi:hypothetical protein